jgi:hypothetical protein
MKKIVMKVENVEGQVTTEGYIFPRLTSTYVIALYRLTASQRIIFAKQFRGSLMPPNYSLFVKKNSTRRLRPLRTALGPSRTVRQRACHDMSMARRGVTLLVTLGACSACCNCCILLTFSCLFSPPLLPHYSITARALMSVAVSLRRFPSRVSLPVLLVVCFLGPALLIIEVFDFL